MEKFLIKHKYIFALALLYFILRFINLTIIPIFNDEAIYLDWGWRELHRNIPFYSLTDGKQPLLMWIFAIVEGFNNDPLFAGRLVSVIAGIFTLIGLYKLGKEIFNEKVARLSALFYIVIPIFSFFDRQALMESAIAATEIWIVYLFIKLLKKSSSKNAVFLGLVIGISFFIKSTVILLVLSIIFIFLISYAFKIKAENKVFLANMVLSSVTSFLVLFLLFLQPEYWSTLYLNSRYSFGISDFLKFPISSWLSNIWAFLQISFWHLTPLVFIAVIIGILLVLKKGEKYQKIILSIFLVQIVLFLFFAKGAVPRYVMPLLPLCVIFVSYVINFYKKWTTVLFGVLIIIPIFFLFLQLFNPLEYFNQMENVTGYSQKGDYVTLSTAGYAAKDAIDYIQNSTFPVAEVTERLDTGNPENALIVYFQNSKRRAASFLEARMINNLSAYKCIYYNFPVYYVSRDYQFAGLESYLQEEKRFYNPEKKSSVGVYHFKSGCSASQTLDLASPGALLELVK